MNTTFKTVVVSGPNGVLGRHVVARLKQAGVTPIAIGRDKWDLLAPPSSGRIGEWLGGANAVIHCSAITPQPGRKFDPADLIAANVTASVALGARAAALNVPMIYIGSGGIYAASDKPAGEDAPLAAMPEGGYYGLSKWLGEKALHGLVPDGLSLCVLRPTSIYGAGLHPEKLVAKMLSAAGKGQVIAVRPPLEERLNLVHACDVAEAAVAAANGRVTGVFNIAGPESVTVLELAQACIAVAGAGRLEEAVGETSTPRRRFDLDGRKARECLSLQPAIGLREGLLMMREERHVR